MNDFGGVGRRVILRYPPAAAVIEIECAGKCNGVPARINLSFTSRLPESIFQRRLFLGIVCLLILFGLQLKHPPWMDSLWPIVQLHRWGNPLLDLLAKRLGTAWPTVGPSYLPLGVAAGGRRRLAIPLSRNTSGKEKVVSGGLTISACQRISKWVFGPGKS